MSPKFSHRPHPHPQPQPQYVTHVELRAALMPIHNEATALKEKTITHQSEIDTLRGRISRLEEMIGIQTPGTVATLEERVATLESFIS